MTSEADRTHPTKCQRPLAAGTVTPVSALTLMLVLAVLGLTLALMLPPAFAAIALTYAAANVLYSIWLKHVAIVDVLLIAFGFVLRMEAGGVLVDVAPTAWMTIMTGLLALFLALAKRRDDLVRGLGQEHRRSLEGYNRAFIDSVLMVLLGALLVAYLIYTTDEQVMARLGTERLSLTANSLLDLELRRIDLWLTAARRPALRWGGLAMNGVIFLADPGKLHDDPGVFPATFARALSCGVVVGPPAAAGEGSPSWR